MNSCYIKRVFLLKNFQQETTVEFAGMPIDSTSCTVTETQHVKSCKIHVKSAGEVKTAFMLKIFRMISLCVVTTTDDYEQFIIKIYN